MAHNFDQTSCSFCNSISHVTEECDVDFSEKSQRYCCSQSDKCTPNLSEISDGCQTHCDSHRKCYICFSRSHCTFECPDQLTVSKLFPPNIDQNLLPRFMQLLELDEKYFLAFKFPVFHNSVHLKSLKISYEKEVTFLNVENFHGSDLVVIDKCCCEKSRFYQFQNIETWKPLPLKPMTFRIQHLEFYLTQILFKEFLQLLSPKTKVLKCGYTKFLPNISLREIFKTAPYLEKLNLEKTKAENVYSWPEDLLQFSRNPKMTEIRLLITDLNLNVNGLADLIRTKSVKINLFISLKNTDDSTKIIKMVKHKLSSRFILEKSKRWRQLLTIILKINVKHSIHYEHIPFDLK